MARTARSEQRAHFAGQLVLLRAKASTRPGEWVKARAKNGLELAWRVGERKVEMVALRRPDQLPFGEDLQFLVETLATEFDGLAVVEKAQKQDAVLLAIREQPCPGCGWPVDEGAMFIASVTCTACNNPNLNRCEDCGRIIEHKPHFSPQRCQGCAMTAGRIADEKRRAKEAMKRAQ